jgi:hypothetical protein
VPGYTGHVPTLKHAVGTTFGSATCELVERPIDAKGDRKALNKVRTCLWTWGLPAGTGRELQPRFPIVILVLLVGFATGIQASLDKFASPSTTQRPALNLDGTGLYLKYS